MRSSTQQTRFSHHAQSPYQSSPFQNARRYAESRGEELDFIPRKERDMKYWVAPGIYQDPKRGTLRWRHGYPPASKTALKRVNMYVIDDTVGSSLGAVILAAKQER